MLKGKAIIELTDVKTGEKEVVEDDNMLTNAIQEIFKPIGSLKSMYNLTQNRLYTSSSYSVNLIDEYYVRTLLGGLILWDNTIPEDPNQLYAPIDVNPVGYGAYGAQNTSTGTARGNYNLTESEFNIEQKYMKYVYDFTTAQANGTIASLSLTHLFGGYSSYGSEDAVPRITLTNNGSAPINYAVNAFETRWLAPRDCTRSHHGSRTLLIDAEILFLTDVENDIVYFCKFTSTTKMSIVKRKINLTSVSLFSKPRVNLDLIEEVELAEFSEAIFTTTHMYQSLGSNYVRNEDCVYFYISSTSSSDSIAANGSFKVIKLDMKTMNTQLFTITNTSGIILNSCSGTYMYVYGGYLYVSSITTTATFYRTYKIKLDNSADITRLETSESIKSILSDYPYGGQLIFTNEINGRIYCIVPEYNNTYCVVIDTKENKQYFAEPRQFSTCLTSLSHEQAINYNNLVQDRGNQMILYRSTSTSTSLSDISPSSFLIVANYLGTINNLQTPVSKTADKTMKITYIIREE